MYIYAVDGLSLDGTDYYATLREAERAFRALKADDEQVTLTRYRVALPLSKGLLIRALNQAAWADELTELADYDPILRLRRQRRAAKRKATR